MQVQYTAIGFLEKNRDTLSRDVIICLRGSSIPLILALFAAQITATGTFRVKKKGKWRCVTSIDFSRASPAHAQGSGDRLVRVRGIIAGAGCQDELLLPPFCQVGPLHGHVHVILAGGHPCWHPC